MDREKQVKSVSWGARIGGDELETSIFSSA